MKNVTRFLTAVFISLVVLICFVKYTIFSLVGVSILLIIIGVYDITQSKHSILRNFPVIGHLRYILEGIGPEIRQYFVEHDTEGKPLNRNQRAYIYSRAKLERTKHPFGTEHDLQREQMEWARHSMYPAKVLDVPPRVRVGGKDCLQPYDASIFNISAMSYGALSKNAIIALNKGAKAGGFFHNTGEGSVSPYHLQGGDLCYQVGTGYFGCRAEDGNFSPEKFKETAAIPEVKLIEVKISQGAKPGHGGILPAVKNNEEIAKIRGVVPHVEVDSPNGHRAFNSAKTLLEFIKQLRDLSGGKPVGFKICIGDKNEFIEICEQMVGTGIAPDFITVDGAEGGTGAAPIIFSDHVGMPYENALIFVVDTLRQYNLKDEIKIMVAGKLIDGFSIFKALCLGADMVYTARGMMLALGCIQALECDMNTCPTGVATDNPSLVRGLVVKDKYKRVANYHAETVKDFLELFAAAGCTNLEELNRTFIFKQMNNKVVAFNERYPDVCAI
ncbi:FMN-binding glutamate synthase family protein [Flavobacteriaceae bacterium Ap0902]|nr:FMN-binding glutamate synthase family protein [Flavobacteriaceae bacterium Ap0902]